MAVCPVAVCPVAVCPETVYHPLGKLPPPVRGQMLTCRRYFSFSRWRRWSMVSGILTKEACFVSSIQNYVLIVSGSPSMCLRLLFHSGLDCHEQDLLLFFWLFIIIISFVFEIKAMEVFMYITLILKKKKIGREELLIPTL